MGICSIKLFILLKYFTKLCIPMIFIVTGLSHPLSRFRNFGRVGMIHRRKDKTFEFDLYQNKSKLHFVITFVILILYFVTFIAFHVLLQTARRFVFFSMWRAPICSPHTLFFIRLLYIFLHLMFFIQKSLIHRI